MSIRLKIFVTLVILFIVDTTSFAQEHIGLSYGQYNGITATSINPTFLIHADNKWEIQLAGAHTFFDTNYGYIKNTSFFNLARNGELVNVPDVAYDDVSDAQDLDVVFNSQYIKTYFDGKLNVLGPGGYYRFNNDIVFGISSKVRSALTSYDIPSSLNYYNAKDLPGDNVFELNEFQVNALVWTEYGIHYAQKLSNVLGVGASIKLASAYTSLSFDNNVNIDYIERADTLSALDKGQGRLAFPVHEGDQPDVIGGGLSFDFGLNYKNEDGSYLGFSIIDLGWVNITGKDYLVDFEEGQSIIYDDYKGIKEVDQQISRMIRDGFQIDSSSSFTMILPTAISLQYQKSLTNKIGIQGHWMQHLKLSDLQLRHTNSTTVSATYDTKHFSAFLPITMFNYSHIRFGAAIRVGFLTIGSDRILNLIGKRDQFSGSDFYINLKYYPFNVSKGDSEKVNCFSF